MHHVHDAIATRARYSQAVTTLPPTTMSLTFSILCVVVQHSAPIAFTAAHKKEIISRKRMEILNIVTGQ